MTVPRLLLLLPIWLVWALRSSVACTQEPQEVKPDTFFAGTVVESTPDRLTVSRVVLGKTEKRIFRITADTKCEGKLKAKVRVTVQYVTTEDGDTAELIVVRSVQKKW